MRLLGSEEFNKTIVAAGPNSAFPHHWPTDYVLQPGDFVTMDYGCTVGGYHSDLTRTVVVGKATEKQKKIYDTVLAAQLAAEDALQAGKTGGELDRVARNIIDATEFSGSFLHNLGHGIGLDIHEGTGLVRDSQGLLKPGMVVSVEPGIYLSGYGGVRIEDLAVVREGGCEILEHSTKELIQL
jgi:Xaa-Pro aminopeptidase